MANLRLLISSPEFFFANEILIMNRVIVFYFSIIFILKQKSFSLALLI